MTTVISTGSCEHDGNVFFFFVFFLASLFPEANLEWILSKEVHLFAVWSGRVFKRLVQTRTLFAHRIARQKTFFEIVSQERTAELNKEQRRTEWISIRDKTSTPQVFLVSCSHSPLASERVFSLKGSIIRTQFCNFVCNQQGKWSLSFTSHPEGNNSQKGTGTAPVHFCLGLVILPFCRTIRG